ncbi:hypothetical protein [Lysinibacillus capsici]|uniref:hypothetical protein n=1 Tax=Lysinibacillus capsici TaxID=2115968 RepID=UPI0034E4D33C
MRKIQTELVLVRKGLSKEVKGLASKGHQPKMQQMSRREIEELMGVNRSAYKRVNGAYRQKG